MKYFAPNILPHHHCFFGADGGVSQGLYQSLNTNTKSQDIKENIDKNLSIIAAHYHLPSSNLLRINQGVTGHAEFADNASQHQITADGIVTTTPDVILCIGTADCAPVLFFDETNGVIGAAHAGWRGALRGVIENTVKIMLEHGARAENIHAAIGPCLQQKSFECMDDMRQEFLQDDAQNFRWFEKGVDEKHFQFNLEGYLVHKLEKLKIGSISASGIDTFAAKGDFFSYRRNCKLGLVNSPKDFPTQLSTIKL